jgi:SAM-dependent methyltransferase
MTSDKRDLITKYDRVSSSYSARYADPGAVARRKVDLINGWGMPILEGASVLELACADGFVTSELVRAGFHVAAVDIAPGMVEAAAQRLTAEGLSAEFQTADIETFDPEKEFDVVLGTMGEFYLYIHDTGVVIKRLASRTRKKLLVDLNPRQNNIRQAIKEVRDAGFDSVTWRGLFVPTHYRVGSVGRTLLRTAEATPLLRGALLRWKFIAVVKGERL